MISVNRGSIVPEEDVSESFVPSNVREGGEGGRRQHWDCSTPARDYANCDRGSTRKNQSFRERSASMPLDPFLKKGHLILSGK